jgi:perosamine synthetase
MNLRPNTEVFIPTLNYISNANALCSLNFIPHFIDSESDSFGIDVDLLEKYFEVNFKKQKNLILNKKTGNIISGLICTHIFGNTNNIDKVKKFCKKNRLFLIEDSSEALGSKFKSKHLGTFGDVGLLSFNGNKIITTGGGGAILTNSKKIYDRMNLLSKNSRHTHKWEYRYSELGFNYRMPSINAQLGLAQIKKLKKFVKLKRSLYLRYKSTFDKISGIKLLREPINTKSNYWLQTILLDKPNIKIQKLIIQHTNSKGFGTRPIWNLLNKNKHLKYCPSMNLDTAKNLEKRIINLPSGAKLCQKR